MKAERVAIVTSPGSVARGTVELLVDRVQARAVDIYSDIGPEPTDADCEQLAKFLRRFEPDVIVAAGGGSVLDLAKAARLRYEHPDVYEISWVLHPKYHRRGYATEVGRALLDHAFRGLGAHRVFATTIEGNDAACRLMARLGMTREAALRKSTQHDGRWLDEYYYSVLDTDYADRQG